MGTPPPSSFTPALTVSALAIRNLDSLSYTRFTLTLSPTASPSVLPRARWLEHGIGRSNALPIAAAALLSDSLPAALPALVPATLPAKSVPKSTSRPPTLWVFAPPPALVHATVLLADAFAPAETAQWTPHAPSQVTQALLDALRRAIASSLHAAGALSLRDQIVHPATNLAYVISLSHNPPATHALLRLRVRRSTLRHLTDLDQPTSNSPPLHVIASPLSIKAILAPRPPAGDALTESVLCRWRESGLLPPGEPADSVVVFLRLPGGVDVPFPRAVVLTAAPQVEEKKNECKVHISKANPEPVKKEKQKSVVPVKSKKRPRSPAIVEEVKKEVFDLPVRDELQDAADRFWADAPTAKSINEAFELAKKAGASDPVPVLLHPAAEEIVPPSFVHDAENQEGIKLDSSSAVQIQSSQLVEEKQIDGRDAVEKRRINGTSLLPAEEKPPPTSVVKQESKESESIDDDIDGFLLVGDSSVEQTGFDTGPTMDMTDFTTFDDEVADFFRDNIDDRLPGTDNTMPNPNEAGGGAQQSQAMHGYRVSEQESDLLQSASNGAKQHRDSKMDVDTELQKNSGWTARGSLQTSENTLKAQNVVNMALSSLRTPTVIPRPDDKSIDSRLSTFYENDLTDRRLVRLNASGSIGKPYSRSERKARRALVRIKKEFDVRRCGNSRRILSPSLQYILTSPVTHKVSFDRAKDSAMGVYVPRRKMKVFSKLRRNGYAVTPTSVLSHVESDSDSDIGDDGDVEAQSLPSTRDPVNGEIKLPLAMKSNGKEDPDFSRGDEVTEIDPLKIVDSVAVDCASACMILAVTRLNQNSQSLAPSSSFFSSGDGNGSLSKGDEEAAKGSVSLQADARLNSTLSNGRPHIPVQIGSPIGRNIAATKREREMLSMLSLLEMQAFSVKELSFLHGQNIPSENTKFALNAQNGRNTDNSASEQVSSATVRRVLLGLPRLLETSHIFGSSSVSVRGHGADSSPLTVQGPLPVEDVLGERSTVLPLDLPRVCVGYKNEWLETPSEVIPLWEKAGLEPYSGRKNVEYVAVAPKEMEIDVKLFLRDLSAAYEECSFGRHAAMPFDEIMWISNSTSKADRNRMKNSDLLSDYEKAMADQYHMTITGLCTKLAAVTRDHRKNMNVAPMNIVVYIISPFENGETAANIALLRAVSPLVSAVPGVVPSVMSVLGPSSVGMGVPSAPWRCASSSKGVVSITVRIVPREVVDRQLSGHAEIKYLLERPLRPQLVKAVSFAVFSSIRSKRVRASKIDGEVAGILTRTPLMPDDLMSPMTPDIVAESPGGNIGTPVSPKGNNLDDTGGCTSIAAHGASFVDQCSALSPSFLHEPAIILSGVGSHMGQTNAKANLVLHLAYAHCETSSRYVFVWTDQRGEVMDIATVPVSKASLTASRRRAFWCMWTRGQRWKISYVGDVHATIAKLGVMQSDELRDWDWVIAKVTQVDSASNDKRYDDVPAFNIIRRFPPTEHSRGDELQEPYTDHPTPATPSTVQPSTQSNNSKATISMDVKLPSVSSITLLNISEADEHLLLEIAERSDEESQRDFAVVSETSLSEQNGIQACAVLAYFGENGIEAIELNVQRHYGKERHTEDMSDDRSPWDAPSAQSITTSIAKNFHELRYIGAPPSWPRGRWLSKYPVHLDIVRRLQTQVGGVQRLAFSSSFFSSK